MLRIDDFAVLLCNMNNLSRILPVEQRQLRIQEEVSTLGTSIPALDIATAESLSKGEKFAFVPAVTVAQFPSRASTG